MVLGVVFSSDLGISHHLDQVFSSCASYMYALRVLRSHGLQPQMRHEVAKMATIASLMYASPAWWGYSSANDRARIDQLLRKLKRSGFCHKRLQMPRPWLVKLMTTSLSQFFWIKTTSCESIFPETRPTNYNLRRIL